MQKTIDSQRRKIKRLEDMIEIIHKADFFQEIPLTEKLSIIDDV